MGVYIAYAHDASERDQKYELYQKWLIFRLSGFIFGTYNSYFWSLSEASWA